MPLPCITLYAWCTAKSGPWRFQLTCDTVGRGCCLSVPCDAAVSLARAAMSALLDAKPCWTSPGMHYCCSDATCSNDRHAQPCRSAATLIGSPERAVSTQNTSQNSTPHSTTLLHWQDLIPILGYVHRPHALDYWNSNTVLAKLSILHSCLMPCWSDRSRAHPVAPSAVSDSDPMICCLRAHIPDCVLRVRLPKPARIHTNCSALTSQCATHQMQSHTKSLPSNHNSQLHPAFGQHGQQQHDKQYCGTA